MPNAYTCLLFHGVFATKNRAPALVGEVQDALYPYMAGILDRQAGHLHAIGGMSDHVHLLIGLRPVHALSTVVRNIKGSSSHWLGETGRLPDTFGWQEGYGGFTVSPSQMARVRHYILHQEEHHRRVSFDREWDELVERHEKAPPGL